MKLELLRNNLEWREAFQVDINKFEKLGDYNKYILYAHWNKDRTDCIIYRIKKAQKDRNASEVNK